MRVRRWFALAFLSAGVASGHVQPAELVFHPPAFSVAHDHHQSPRDYLTAYEFGIVCQNMPTYQEWATIVGVPVLILPVIQYLESSLLPTKNIGGPYMLDCGKNGTEGFDDGIRNFERWVGEKYNIFPAPRVRDDFAFATLCCAVELKSKSRGPFWDKHGTVNIDVLGDACWGYNGRAGRGWDHSPYVWNHPKHKRKFLIRTGKVPCVCERPGALVLYWELERRFKHE